MNLYSQISNEHLTRIARRFAFEHGATVTTSARIDAGTLLNVHGERDIAIALTAMAPGSRVKAVANTAFGTYTQIIWSEEGEPIPETRGEKGLVITQILSTEPPD